MLDEVPGARPLRIPTAQQSVADRQLTRQARQACPIVRGRRSRRPCTVYVVLDQAGPALDEDQRKRSPTAQQSEALTQVTPTNE